MTGATSLREELRMANPEYLALQNSRFNTFLFAEIGTERNGSSLTILSALARLGRDPWKTSAVWAREPTDAVIEALTAVIVSMELGSLPQPDARVTAARLVPLLRMKAPAPAEGRTGRPAPGLLSVPKWAANALLYGALALGLGASLIRVPAHSTKITVGIEQGVGGR